MGLSLNNLAVTTANKAMASAMGAMFNTLYSKLANGGRDRNCKFYYNEGAGGSILQVVAKSVVGGVVSELKDVAVNEFNSLLDGKKNKDKEGSESNWIKVGREKRDKEGGKYGMMNIDGGAIIALDDWGVPSADALMLAAKLDDSKKIHYRQEYYYTNTVKASGMDGTYNYVEESHSSDFSSSTLVWYDTTALITINSEKNMVISRVQGRDYSRKELVSNGDIKFSVTGQITGRIPDVYPTEEVKKFIQIMQYKGIIHINNQMLDQFNISDIVITDFNLSPKQGYKSVQSYSFSAVGLQPEFVDTIQSDTIVFEPSKPMSEEEDSGSEWMKMLNNNLNGLKSMAKDAFSQGAALATGMLDSKL